jgi:nucleotide-binding universal stress UspA family protein
LCAVDFSPAAKSTVSAALALAAAERAPLTVLHVLEALPEAGAVLPRLPKRVRGEMEAEALLKLAELVPGEGRSGAVERTLGVGRAHREILRLAASLQADLIVLGAGSHGAIGRMVLGSTAERVVREASCPVLTVRAAGAAREARGEPPARAAS